MPYSPQHSELISAGNSSTTLLGASGVFTGTSENVSGFVSVSIFVYASHASATDGLQVQWSHNNTNWDYTDVFTVLTTTGKAISLGIRAEYIRIVFTNGATLQTAFRLQTLLHSSAAVPSALLVTGGGAEDSVLRVTLANDSTGLVSVDDNGSTLSVDDGAGSLTVDAPVGTPVAVRLSDGTAFLTTTSGRLSVDASSVAVPVTDNASSLTVDNSGTFAVQAAQTGTWTVQPGNTANTTAWLTDPRHGKTLKSSSFSLTATGTVITAVASKRLKVYAYKLVCSAAITVNWRDGASTALEGGQAFAANGGAVENVDPPSFVFATTAGNSLDLVISGTGTAAGRVSYWDDDSA